MHAVLSAAQRKLVTIYIQKELETRGKVEVEVGGRPGGVSAVWCRNMKAVVDR